METVAQKLRVRGTVQGVGFRPFVYVLATEEQLSGTVHNDGQGVEIFLQGSSDRIENFKRRLFTELPPLAKIEEVTTTSVEPIEFQGFKIIESQHNDVNTVIPADAAVCPECVKEMTDPRNRRYRYPFINCTHCGPRYTITRHLPYDRPQTSMKDFQQCPECLKEYTNPLDRRFHAQPNACPVCGPQVQLVDSKGNPIACNDVFEEVLARIRSGQILAIKGLGGFHLVCDAKNRMAVKKLRERKNRPTKPFALMVLNEESASPYVEISSEATKKLHSSVAPIVLCPKKAGADERLQGIAPGLSEIGFMLPYTPIHWLIFFEAANRPDDRLWMAKPLDLILVMTSANAGGEPLVIDNQQSLDMLGGICDAFLVHNRDILIRCDDSLIRPTGKDFQLVRRARGYTPSRIRLAQGGPQVVATGSWMKNTACLAKDGYAYLSQHIGDLDRVTNCNALKMAIDHLMEIFEISPQYVACDMHPDFYSGQLAEEIADRFDAKLITVQHHHAHIASVAAEHHIERPVLGMALDGVGYGTDGTAWGGELLRVDGALFDRLGHLQKLDMPGGDLCARQGWRMAYAFLKKHHLGELAQRLFPFRGIEILDKVLESSLPIPQSTSMGRLFDTAASLLKVAHHSTYEGEAPMLLEAISDNVRGAVIENGFAINDGTLDFSNLLLSLINRKDTEQAAADFHMTVASGLAEWASRASEASGINAVCLSGGCCLNTHLMGALRHNLNNIGLKVYEAVDVPPNDGGLSLGQAWVAIMNHNQFSV